jgi:hypothetical protein
MDSKEVSPLAIASLAFSCLGALTLGILAIPGIICGQIAKKQVRNGQYSGHSLAQAGVIVGVAVLVLWLAVPALLFGAAGIIAFVAYVPWIAAVAFGIVLFLALLPFAFTSIAKRRDTRSLQRIVGENKARS